MFKVSDKILETPGAAPVLFEHEHACMVHDCMSDERSLGAF
jgi:hypothetical protein